MMNAKLLQSFITVTKTVSKLCKWQCNKSQNLAVFL